MNNIVKKIVVSITVLTCAVWMMGPGVAQAVTAAELQATIDSLLAQIADLQAQLVTLTGVPTIEGVPADFTFETNLKLTDTGDDVKYLQIVLNSDSATQLAATGVGSAGNETSYFGPLTKAAVIKFQEKYAEDVLASYGLTAGTGFVGLTTRAKLNTILVAAEEEEEEEEEEVVVPGTALAVALAADTPVSVVVPEATNVSFTKINLTAGTDGDISITSLSLKRQGIGQAADIAGVTLYLDGVKKGDARTFNSVTNKAIFNYYSTPLVIKAGTTSVLEAKVAIDATACTGSEQHQIGIVSADDISVAETGVTISGLPVYGNMMTLSNTPVAQLTATATYTSNVNKNIGLTAERFAEFNLGNSSAEDVKVNSIRLTEGGSIGGSEISNLKLLQGATELSTTVKVDDVTKYVTFTLAEPFLIKKGNTKPFTIKGDIISGYNRTIKLYFSSIDDIDATGQTYGFGATLVYTAFDSDDANSAQITVTGGALNMALAAGSPVASNIIASQDDVVFGKWIFTTTGSVIDIKNLEFTLTFVGAPIDDELTDIKLWDESTGAVISGPADSDATSAGNEAIDLTDDFTLPESGAVIYKLTADVNSSATATSYQFKLNTTVGTGTLYPYSQDSRTILAAADVVPSATTINAATMTRVSTALTVTKSATPATQYAVVGKTGLSLVGYSFQASAANDMTISQITFTGSASAGNPYDEILSAELWDETSKISGPYNLDSSNEVVFPGLSYVIPASTSKKLLVKANLASTAGTASYALGIVAAANIVAFDTSGNSVTASDGDATWNQGNTYAQVHVIATAAGSLSLAKATDQILAHILLTGASKQEVAKFKLTAANEIIDVSEMTIVNAGSNDADILKVYLYDGTTLVASGDLSNHQVSLTGLSIEVPKNGSKTLSIKVDLNYVTLGANSADKIQFEIAGLVQGTGRDSGTTIYASSNASIDATAFDFANDSKISRWSPTTTATVVTANTLPFAVTKGDIVYYYSAAATSYTWGIVTTYTSTTAFVIKNAANTDTNTLTVAKQFSRITPSSTGTVAAANTLPSALTVGDIVLYSKAGTYDLGVVTVYTSTTVFTIESVSGVQAANTIANGSQISVITPSSTGVLTAANTLPIALTVGDIVIYYGDTATSYTWGIVTAYASATSFTITDDAGNADTTITNAKRISKLSPSTTGTELGTNDTGVALAVGDLVMAQAGGNYGLGVVTTGSIDASVQTLYNTKITVAAASTQPSTTVVQGDQVELGRFTVSNATNNANADARITQIVFTVESSNSTIDTYKLYKTDNLSDSLSEVAEETVGTGLLTMAIDTDELIIAPNGSKELILYADFHYQDGDAVAGGVSGTVVAKVASFGSVTNKGVVTAGKITWDDGIVTAVSTTGITWTDSTVNSVSAVTRGFSVQSDTYAPRLLSVVITEAAAGTLASADTIVLTYTEPIAMADSTGAAGDITFTDAGAADTLDFASVSDPGQFALGAAVAADDPTTGASTFTIDNSAYTLTVTIGAGVTGARAIGTVTNGWTTDTGVTDMIGNGTYAGTVDVTVQ